MRDLFFIIEKYSRTILELEASVNCRRCQKRIDRFTRNGHVNVVRIRDNARQILVILLSVMLLLILLTGNLFRKDRDKFRRGNDFSNEKRATDILFYRSLSRD